MKKKKNLHRKQIQELRSSTGMLLRRACVSLDQPYCWNPVDIKSKCITKKETVLIGFVFVLY